MREIKFRAWFNGKRKMVYNLGFDDRSFTTLDDPTLEENEMPAVWDKDCIIDDSYYEGAFSFELMQYTGLKDKNGVEIYEGDILLEKNCKVWGEYTKDDGITWLKMTNKTEDRLYQVFYDEKTCQFTTNRGWLWPLSNLTEVIGNLTEVIGNIYENPELIKGES